MSETKSGKVFSIKMLLTNNLAGSLIGLGGKSIKDLIEVSGAKIHVSASAEPYPGTSDRVIVISGDFDCVSLAQNLIWEMIGLISSAENPREVQWNPKDMVNFLGQHDDAEVTGKVTIPAAAGGLILGKAGANIQSMAEESGANVGMSSKEEAIFTQERVLTITGTLGSCMKATSLIMQKLDEPAEFIPYVNKGTSYSTAHMQSNPFVMPFGGYGVFGAGIPYPTMGAASGSRRDNRQLGQGGQGGHRGGNGHGNAGSNGYYAGNSELDNGAGATPVETTITFTVPDEMVGNILGKMGSTMREIIGISKAKVTVSPRGEYVEGGSNNRVVTITGAPANAQTAHMLINQRLQTPAAPRRPRNSNHNNNSANQGNSLNA